MDLVQDADWSKGAAYIDGQVMPVAEAKIPITDWGYRRSDVTYDVVGVYYGSFFRLDEHIARFRRSMQELRMEPKESDAELRQILIDLVRRTGLREAYVAMDCLRGRPPRGVPFHPAFAKPYIAAFAIPWVWLFTEEQQARGVHAIIAKTPRIAPESVDPTVKNFHWGDLTKALFEAEEAGAETAFLLDQAGFLTEGPGYNCFAVIDGTVVSPPRGALLGQTRDSVYELCQELGIPHDIRPISKAELEDADEIFMSTTAGGIMPVSRLGTRILGNDRPGPISATLRETFWKKREQGWHATPVNYDKAPA
ncbi:branched-chain amino acid aminotransferase [Arboricoccus pini]|uniref:Probable branched-chain-amino-acid aminotransferase n=1 Tax=Arboricoccus pini TaxID=1963835 RepID=A0A212RHZ3_9PROT|nr:aminotransferase class IV [Arboricoccus pini]SNB71996.1 branched-chain amino acid aminotransferase [Arboricoccus pini]